MNPAAATPAATRDAAARQQESSQSDQPKQQGYSDFTRRRYTTQTGPGEVHHFIAAKQMGSPGPQIMQRPETEDCTETDSEYRCAVCRHRATEEHLHSHCLITPDLRQGLPVPFALQRVVAH